ncbi:hypothetical protein F5Y07DRAFT_409757 [Xylaria sp. FL0933]|nr:hypothetical protein F5Y07DRAFT_409757 [Xylaria sp. FL0933]
MSASNNMFDANQKNRTGSRHHNLGHSRQIDLPPSLSQDLARYSIARKSASNTMFDTNQQDKTEYGYRNMSHSRTRSDYSHYHGSVNHGVSSGPVPGGQARGQDDNGGFSAPIRNSSALHDQPELHADNTHGPTLPPIISHSGEQFPNTPRIQQDGPWEEPPRIHHPQASAQSFTASGAGPTAPSFHGMPISRPYTTTSGYPTIAPAPSQTPPDVPSFVTFQRHAASASLGGDPFLATQSIVDTRPRHRAPAGARKKDSNKPSQSFNCPYCRDSSAYKCGTRGVCPKCHSLWQLDQS